MGDVQVPDSGAFGGAGAGALCSVAVLLLCVGVALGGEARDVAVVVDRLLVAPLEGVSPILQERRDLYAGVGREMAVRAGRLTTDDQRVRLAIAIGIVREPPDEVAEALVTIVSRASDTERVTEEAVRALEVMGSQGVAGLIRAAKMTSVNDRADTVVRVAGLLAKRVPSAAIVLAEVLGAPGTAGKKAVAEILSREKDGGCSLFGNAGIAADYPTKLMLGDTVGRIGRKCMPYIVDVIQRKNVNADLLLIAVSAADTLGEDAPELADLIAAVARSETAPSDVRVSACGALAQMARPADRAAQAIRILLTALSAKDHNIRVLALQGLRRIGERGGEVARAFVHACYDSELTVRVTAFLGLPVIADPTPEVLAALIHGLQDSSPRGQLEAARSALRMKVLVLEAGLKLGALAASREKDTWQDAFRGLHELSDEHGRVLMNLILEDSQAQDAARDIAQITVLGSLRVRDGAKIVEFLRARAASPNDAIRSAASAALEERHRFDLVPQGGR